MQLNFRLMSVMALTVLLSFTACKKEDKSSTNTGSNSEMATHSEDQNEVSGDMDDVSNEANMAIEGNANFSGKMQVIQGFCGATVAFDSLSDPMKITITYNGNNCLGTRSRTGTVIISMPFNVRWKDAGATITVTYQNLKITRLSDNKSITINGSHTITNVSGGLLMNLPSLGTITHSLNSSGMTITFDDGSQRSWQIAKQRVFTYNNGIVISTTGTHTDGNNAHIAEWGTNRFGHAFTTSITEPLVIRQDCSFRLVSGQVTHQGFATATVTFGLDANGNPTSCPGTGGHYYYKLTWTGSTGTTQTVILPY